MANFRYRFSIAPEYKRMTLVALSGVVLGFLTYELIYFINPFSPRGTTSWVAAFLIGIIRQHSLHRRFTFALKTHYWKSLYRASMVDVITLTLGAALNWLLIEHFLINHQIAWGCCLLLKAAIGLIALKNFVFKPALKTDLIKEQ